MTIGLSSTIRNSLATALNTAVGASAKIRLYNLGASSRPATGGSIPGTATLLIELTGNAAGFGDVSGAAITLKAVAAGTATGGGSGGLSANFARILTSGSTFCYDADVTVTGGGGDMTMDSTLIQTGATVTPGTITLTVGSP